MNHPQPALGPCIPLPLDKDLLDEVIVGAKDFAVTHGIGMRYRDKYDGDSLYFAPFVLLPSVFPKKEFEEVVDVQTSINELIHKVAHDQEFLTKTLSTTIECDDFTKRLFDIYETVIKEGITQPLSFGKLRSDIMLDTHQQKHASFCCTKQVEINTIASGFGWLGPASQLIHRVYASIAFLPHSNDHPPTRDDCGLGLGILRSDYMTCLNSCLAAKQIEINTIASSFGAITTRLKKLHKFVLSELGHHDLVQNIPDNAALQNIADTMIQAWNAYGSPKGVILFIVEDITYNICDQKLLQFEIQSQNPELKIIRKTLTEVYQTGRLGSSRKELLIDQHEVALVYFRCGYAPSQYPSEKEWEARLLIERSLAIKCPSIYYHLAGTKKVQQELSVPGVLERFLGEDKEKIRRIRKFFAGLYPLDLGSKGDAVVEMVNKSPEKFVLKPQREGGGNNIYGADIKPFMTTFKEPKERSAYIVMDRIWPPIMPNYLIVSGKKEFEIEDCVSELGIFGCILGSKDEVIFNRQTGHMLRTKSNSSNEGGVASGSGALDSVYLLDIEAKDKDCKFNSC